ncbi:PAS domain S-box-containing protein [Rhodobacter sp. JA431]|uniref:ATP-binding protein n=1 Tax=Rhodobacter sp. JA431 TaxID=570013 RepID=UPI000BC83205|nr:ATP-binding protein [Rhodobacter sp. JA431]SOC04842.1 PAS domain S-box-containing protein [Rhodobacter sp. JA431]
MSDTSNPFRERPQVWRNILFAGLVVLIFGAVAGLYRYGVSVRSEIDTLAIANSDSLQWTLAQLEVEYFHLEAAMTRADPAVPKTLSDLSRDFDIFYARVNTIREGKGFREVLTSAPAITAITRIATYTDTTAKIFDAGPEALTEALPALRDATDEIMPIVRDLSLGGVRAFAERSMAQREQVFASLIRLASLTAALLVTLSGGFVATWWLWRYGRNQTRSLYFAKARLEAVISTSIDAVIVVDQEARVVEFNGAAEKVFGYSRNEAIGAPMTDLIVPHHMKTAHDAGFKRYRAGGVPRIAGHGLIGLQARRKNGDLFPAELSVTATRIGKHEIFVGYLRDITDRVAAEQELIDARDQAMAGERAQSEFVAVMSHEMRNPLNGLLGTVDLLSETELDDTQRRFVDSMQKAGEILLSHVNNTLDVERLDAGKFSLTRAPFAPIALADEVVQMQSGTAAARGNQLIAHVEGDLPTAVEGDALRIRQVLINLVGNAIKFTENGTVSIEVEYHRDQGLLEYRVIDTGVGIPPDQTERIFDDFVTLDPELSREATGTGLGLSIARRLVRAMRGEIGVESEEGKGSAFWITVPVPVVLSMPEELTHPPRDLDLTVPPRPQAPLKWGDEPEPTIHVSADAPLVLKPRRPLPPPDAAAVPPCSMGTDGKPHLQGPVEVLVVEDNDINRVVLCEMLRRGGHKFDEARDGREGVEAAEKHRFDVILIDLNMPRMNGIEATEAIRAGNGPNKHTPVIAVTANVLPEARARLEAAGVCRVISKPITRKILEQVLSDELCESRMAMAAQRAPAPATATPPATAAEPLTLRPLSPAPAAPKAAPPRIAPGRSPAGGSPAKAPAADAPLLNIETHTDLAQSLGEELMAQTLRQFLSEAETMLPRLTIAAAQAEPAATAALAHKLAGSAALMGAERLHRTLKAIDTPLRHAVPGATPPDPVVAALIALPAVWSTTRARVAPIQSAKIPPQRENQAGAEA